MWQKEWKMLITKNVDVIISSRRERYKKLGYKIPNNINNNTTINVKVEDLPKGSHVKIKWKCDKCNKIIEDEYRNFLRHKKDENNNIYCCNCASSVFCSKEKHYNWKKELTDDYRIYRSNRRLDPEYNKFIKLVLSRDNFTCQVCHNKNKGNLVVHHLESYNNNQELSKDITNGICLCKDCHKNFHRIYGKGNNTRKQFNEWSNIITENITKKHISINDINAIYCIEDDEIIYNMTYYCKQHKGVYTSSLNKCCNGKQATVNNKHYIYYIDYINKTKKEIEEYIKYIDNKFKRNYSQYIKMKNNKNFKKIIKQVICIEEKILFEKMTDAKKYINAKSLSSITRACKNNSLAYGKHWCYLEDYKEDINKLRKVGDT